jgi:RsiW-degrading membrane proteinase PrsW (M82 family)
LLPYFFIEPASKALLLSVIVTVIALFTFGYVKSRLLGSKKPWWGAAQMAFVGALAAGAAFGVAKLIPVQDQGVNAISVNDPNFAAPLFPYYASSRYWNT